MKIRSINFNFVLYLALIEGISFFLASSGVNSFLVGFLPMLTVLLMYKLISDYLPVKINNMKMHNLPLVALSVINGLFIMLLFFVQDMLYKIPWMQNLLSSFRNIFGDALFGFLSVFLSALVLLLIYNYSNLEIIKIKFKIPVVLSLNRKKVMIKKINYLFVAYMGIFEAFILPIMVSFSAIHPFLNGLISGFIGGAVAWIIVNAILSKNSLELLLQPVQ